MAKKAKKSRSADRKFSRSWSSPAPGPNTPKKKKKKPELSSAAAAVPSRREFFPWHASANFLAAMDLENNLTLPQRGDLVRSIALQNKMDAEKWAALR